MIPRPTGPGASNVIPEQVVLSGTIRALTPARFDELRARVARVIALTAEAHGCDGSNVTWEAVPYPPTVNDPGMQALVRRCERRRPGSRSGDRHI